MANSWDLNPDWNPLAIINGGVTLTLNNGFLASDQNKIIENLQYLYNHLMSQHVYVGSVTTNTLEPGAKASVTIRGRFGDDDENNESELYLDFVFNIPQGPQGLASGFGTPSATAEGLEYGQKPTVSVAASGPDEAKIFVFHFGLPSGPEGPMGPPGPSVAAGLTAIDFDTDVWIGSSPYTFQITPAMHQMGNTPTLIAFTYYYNAVNQTYEETYDSPIVSKDGTITVYSNTKYTGRLLVAGGIAEGVDLEARTQLADIQKSMPTDASEDNKLATRDFVNSSVNNIAARFVIPVEEVTDATQAQWTSLVALRAGPWYFNGTAYTPTQNDYAIYLNIDKTVWRAYYTGEQWVPQYKVNDTPFTAAQLAAINSGITQELTDDLIDHLTDTNNPHSVTKSQVGLSAVPNVDATDADNITSGTLNTLRLAADRLVAGDNVTLTRDPATGKITITASTGQVAPYVLNLTASDWIGTTAPYAYAIFATAHLKGQYPSVRTFVNNEETYDSPRISASGDITLYSNTKTAMRVVIK